MSIVRQFVVLIAASLVSSSALSQTQDNAPVTQLQIPETTAAALLIQAGKLDDAKRVLAHVLEMNPNDKEAIFLQGMIAVLLVQRRRIDVRLDAELLQRISHQHVGQEA